MLAPMSLNVNQPGGSFSDEPTSRESNWCGKVGGIAIPRRERRAHRSRQTSGFTGLIALASDFSRQFAPAASTEHKSTFVDSTEVAIPVRPSNLGRTRLPMRLPPEVTAKPCLIPGDRHPSTLVDNTSHVLRGFAHANTLRTDRLGEQVKQKCLRE